MLRMSSPARQILAEARFDAKLVHYYAWYTVLVLVLCVITIPVAPLG